MKLELNQIKVPKRTKEEDKLINAIGEFGKWQILMLGMVVWVTRISGAWQQLGIIFIAPNTTFICTQTNLTDTPEISKCYKDCTNYEYYTEFGNTIISQWELICDRGWMANFTQTVAMFGVLVGSIFFGFMADRYGRRPALLTACMLQLTMSIIEAFCPTYWSFTSIRFFVGTATAGVFLCAFILIMEITGPNHREMVACLCAIPLGVGGMTMPIFSYFLRTYDMFCLGVAIPNLLYLLYFFLLPESPKWLISVGRLEEASLVMTKAAKWNNMPSENMIDVAKMIASEKVESNEKAQKDKATYLDLVKTKSLRLNTICCCTVWFLVGIIYYGSNQYIGQTSSNVFISISVAGALQIPGTILASIMCIYIGRRITLISLFIICTFSYAVLVVPEYWFYLRLVAGTIALSSASGAFCTLYMYTSELFPTVARNMAMGASSTVSRIGSMIAPFLVGLNVTAPWLPPSVFAIMPLIAAVTCYLLPETRGKKLPDYLA